MARETLDDLYRHAMAAAAAQSPAQQRRALEELAWDEARLYGGGARHEEGGKRFIAAGSSGSLVPIEEASEQGLRRFTRHQKGSIPVFYKDKVRSSDLIKKKVTIYTGGTFGHNKTEANAYFFQVRPYAQYDRALELHWLPKGAHKARGTIVGYKPQALILEGWGHPDPDSPWTDVVTRGNVTTARTRALSHDPSWSRNFYTKVDSYLAHHPKVKVLLDVRGE